MAGTKGIAQGWCGTSRAARLPAHSAKHFPDLVEKAPFVLIRFRLEVRRVTQFFEHVLFFRCYVLGRPDVYVNQLVPSFIGVDCREALPLQPEDLAALGTCRNLDLRFTIDGRDFGLKAKN